MPSRSRAHLRLPALLACALLGLLLAPPTPTAVAVPGVYHVSTTGSDRGDGSAGRPWRSIRRATATAPPGAVILVDGGTYGPFAVTKPGQTVTAAPQERVVVRGRRGVRDVVRVAAPSVTVRDLTVTGCVPDPTPAGGFNDGGSSTVRIGARASNATLTGLTVRGRRFLNQHRLPFGCYGILAHGADGSRIIGNDISGTGTGVYLNGGGRGALVAGNRIHDNRVLIRNTPGGNDDYGANAVTFSHVSAVPGPVATGNVVTRNAGRSADYGVDGGAFEIYGSSHVSITRNTISDNENVLETGTSPGGDHRVGDCVGNVFAGNVARGRAPGSRLRRSVGLILRCATAMQVRDNTLTGLDWWVYVISTRDRYSSDVTGLTITGNTVVADQKVYSLGVDPMAARLLVDANRIRHTGRVFASHADGSTSPDLGDWQRRTLRDLVTVGS